MSESQPSARQSRLLCGFVFSGSLSAANGFWLFVRHFDEE
ncbi:hypothetical protein B4113_1938 [Geobacillus sp. B4113_201601]|nr:hypothetical protein B4113_1938 [Geobacillus sp. B4113_201601]